MKARTDYLIRNIYGVFQFIRNAPKVAKESMLTIFISRIPKCLRFVHKNVSSVFVKKPKSIQLKSRKT